ncbi:MAG: LysE family translocator [Candidatus Poseidoniales archaeon]|nr:LysE family translocator [Candidatus Poseidoniales archaeon]
MDIVALTAAVAFMVPMCFSPGPNNLLCAAHGSQHGFRNTIPLTLGMVIGWSTLGIGVGMASTLIEENEEVFTFLSWIGAFYIAYLAYKMATTKLGDLNSEDSESTSSLENTEQPLGLRTGLVLQIVNGKAWIHFLVLMTTFGATFGHGLMSKISLVGLNGVFGYCAVLTWTVSGVTLRKIFSSPKQAKVLNLVLAFTLLVVAIWIVIPD